MESQSQTPRLLDQCGGTLNLERLNFELCDSFAALIDGPVQKLRQSGSCIPRSTIFVLPVTLARWWERV